MNASSSFVTVLSGDLIGSSEAGPSETNLAIIRVLATAAAIERWDDSGPTYFTRVRGDGWQFILRNPKYALRSSLRVFANLICVKGLPQTRIAIGLGEIDHIEGSDLSSASGHAFEASGRTLDAMAESDRFAIAGVGVTPLHHAIVALIEDHISRWTPEQAEAAAYYLDPTDPTLKQIAGSLGISTQAVHSRIKGGGAQALRQAVNYWEDHAEQALC
jgi:hypothetical protein